MFGYLSLVCSTWTLARSIARGFGPFDHVHTRPFPSLRRSWKVQHTYLPLFFHFAALGHQWNGAKILRKGLFWRTNIRTGTRMLSRSSESITPKKSPSSSAYPLPRPTQLFSSPTHRNCRMLESPCSDQHDASTAIATATEDSQTPLTHCTLNAHGMEEHIRYDAENPAGFAVIATLPPIASTTGEYSSGCRTSFPRR